MAKKPTRRAGPRETLSLLSRPFQKREHRYRRRSRPVGLDHERRFRFFPDLSRSENTGTGEDGDFWDAPHSRAEHAASLRQRGPPTGFPPLTSRLAACFFADMRGVPARLPCRTAPRTPVPAIPPADGPLACQCRTSTPVPAIPLVPASPSTYRARAPVRWRVWWRAHRHPYQPTTPERANTFQSRLEIAPETGVHRRETLYTSGIEYFLHFGETESVRKTKNALR